MPEFVLSEGPVMRILRPATYATAIAVILSAFLILDTQGVLELGMSFKLGIALALAAVPGVNALANEFSAKRLRSALVASHLSSARSFLKETKLGRDLQVTQKTVRRKLRSIDPEEAGIFHFRREVFRALFPQIRPNEKDYLAALSLVRDYKNAPQLEIAEAIARFIQTRHLDDISEGESPAFLGAYFRCIIRPTGTRIDSVFVPATHSEMKSALTDIVQSFLEAPYLRFFEDELRNERDLRRTLRDLATRAEYLATEIGEEAAERIARAIDTTGEGKKPLLVLKADSGAHRKIFSRVLDGVPRAGGTVWITDVPDLAAQRFGMWILRPTGTQTAMELADDLKSRVLVEAEGFPSYEAVARAYLLEETGTFPRVIPETGELQNARLRVCGRLLSHFDSADRKADVDKALRQVFIPAEDVLLKLLPFNLFVTDLTESERGFLYSQYPAVKRAFGVKRLTEWENHDPDRIQGYLEGIGHPDYSDEEARAKFGVRASKEITQEMIGQRMGEIATEIVRQAGRYRRSLAV